MSLACPFDGERDNISLAAPRRAGPAGGRARHLEHREGCDGVDDPLAMKNATLRHLAHNVIVVRVTVAVGWLSTVGLLLLLALFLSGRYL